MTREEAIKFAKAAIQLAQEEGAKDFYRTALAALTPPTPERIAEVWGSEWEKRRRHTGGFRRHTGIDDFGETRTVVVDERAEYDDLYCKRCGKQSADNFLNFCPYCGAAQTPEALEIVRERLEVLEHGKAD